jgi:hypothetical protein
MHVPWRNVVRILINYATLECFSVPTPGKFIRSRAAVPGKEREKQYIYVCRLVNIVRMTASDQRRSKGIHIPTSFIPLDFPILDTGTFQSSHQEGIDIRLQEDTRYSIVPWCEHLQKGFLPHRTKYNVQSEEFSILSRLHL